MSKAKSVSLQTKKTQLIRSQSTPSDALLFKSSGPLSPQGRHRTLSVLEPILINAMDLQIQTKLAHWNVRGPHFFSLHPLFDQVFNQVAEGVDAVAERMAQMGGLLDSSVQTISEKSALPTYTPSATGSACLQTIVSALSQLIRQIHEGMKHLDHDASSLDLVTGWVRELEKQLWMVEAHLQTI